MDTQRAKEIANSADMANVTYEGKRIYIQNVDERNETAGIYELENPENQQKVSVNSLEELTTTD
ncbi:small acid-soluble spore protein H [Paenibacillus sp. GP183]|jgi:small acid-soluble spore protein H (minor)|uniref:small acid-soluble spore protein H n=1 Tax=Paenibacillus sp. GP183 TaxID=1882751 RepID=UPI00089B27F7|nr:small acid-soluble spore protein H [Paenibacillus sp. GP183]SEB45476.1 small acid-soluble spore protein H (minor) [Paenibacillus sp. GP183]